MSFHRVLLMLLAVMFAAFSHDVQAAVPGASASAATSATSAATEGEDEFLPVRDAFHLTVDREKNAFVAHWQIADHYYLYRERLKITLVDNNGKPVQALGNPQLPKGEFKNDEIFGRVEIYHHDLRVRLPVQNLPAPLQATLKVTYQGCAEAGLCYPPETEEWPVDFSGMQTAANTASATVPAQEKEIVSGAAENPAPENSSAPMNLATVAVAAQEPAASTSTTDPAAGTANVPAAQDAGAIANFLAHASIAGIIGAFLLLGLGLAFTPCVLPMVPILSSIIVGEGQGISTRRAFLLSLAYVLGMALTYTAAGVAVGFLGAKASLSMWLQSPPVLVFFAIVFVVLSLSMFGFYELQVPSFLRDRLHAAAGKQQGGRLVSVAVMGAISALVVSPCVSAPLAGALVFISSTGNAVLGGAALFALAMGMGLPLLLIGTTEGKFLPKTGLWMNDVKVLFGVMLLGIAVLLVGRVLPGPVSLALWGMLFTVYAIYIDALEPLDELANGWVRLRKGLGVVSLLCGVMLLAGAAAGADDPLRPLGFLTERGSSASTVTGATQEAPLFTRVKDRADLDAKLAAAKAAGKPVLLDYFAEWCVACKLMERHVFSQPSVHAALAGYVRLQVDATANDEAVRDLLAAHRVMGLPASLFFRADGSEISDARVLGEMSEAEFLAYLRDRIEPVAH